MVVVAGAGLVGEGVVVVVVGAVVVRPYVVAETGVVGPSWQDQVSWGPQLS